MLLNPHRFGAAPVGGDPHFSSVSLLLHGDGTSGSTTFTDNSPTPKTLTLGSSPVTLSTAVKKYGSSSMYVFGGHLNAPTGVDFEFPDDLTVEGWFYFVNSNDHGLFGFGSSQNDANGGSAWVLGGSITFYWAQGVRISGPAITLNSWTHIAVTRSGGVWRMFVNGVVDGSYTNAVNVNEGIFKIGANSLVNGKLSGYIDDFRVTKGVARYTANFTPPTAAFPDF